jgi:hypothetical protein
MSGSNASRQGQLRQAVRSHRSAFSGFMVVWAATWSTIALWLVVTGNEGLDGPFGLLMGAVLFVVLPCAGGALVGWLRQRYAPVESELGPITVRYVTLTEAIAAAVGAAVMILNLAVILAVAALQAEPPPPGREESWWEPLLVILLFGIAGFVLGLVGGALGGLLAAVWRRVHHSPERAESGNWSIG